jgi:chromosome partitioning protein
MATTIAFINLKGGVAKTTTAVATAQILSGVHRKKVLLIDLDPQTNATVMLIGDAKWKALNDRGHTVAQLFRDALDPANRRFELDATLQTRVGGVGEARTVSLIPSSLDLIRIQDDLVTMPTGRYRAQTPIDILYRAIRDRIEDYDFVLIDCPPSLGLITLNGLRFADGYVIPTVPDVLSTYGIPQIVERVADFAQEIGEPIEPYGIVATKYQANSTVHQNQLRILRRQQDAPVFESVIGQTNELSAAAEFNSAVTSTLRQKWGYREGFPAYSQFVTELLESVGAGAAA